MKASFRVRTNKNLPPVLVVELESEGLYEELKSRIDKEEFLRIRRVTSKFRKIVINSLSDIEKLEKGEPTSVDIRLETGDPDQEIIEALERSPIWAIAICSPDEYISLEISKSSERILTRGVHVREKATGRVANS